MSSRPLSPLSIDPPAPDRQPAHAVRVRLIVGSICALLFSLDLFAVESGAIVQVDRSLEITIHGWFGHTTFGVFSAISTAGGTLDQSLAVTLITLGLLLRSRWRSAAILAGAVAGGSLVDQVVKLVVARPRPHLFPGALHASGYSFPSGHAMNATIVFGVLIYLSWVLTHRRTVVGIVTAIGLLVTLLVGLSRIVLGVHYPTDVFGGFMLGSLWLAGVFAATSVLERVFDESGNRT